MRLGQTLRAVSQKYRRAVFLRRKVSIFEYERNDEDEGGWARPFLLAVKAVLACGTNHRGGERRRMEECLGDDTEGQEEAAQWKDIFR